MSMKKPKIRGVNRHHDQQSVSKCFSSIGYLHTVSTVSIYFVTVFHCKGYLMNIANKIHLLIKCLLRMEIFIPKISKLHFDKLVW